MTGKDKKKTTVKKNDIPEVCKGCAEEQCPDDCPHTEAYQEHLRNKRLDT